jgi:Family of unknown function (DUF5947)
MQDATAATRHPLSTLRRLVPPRQSPPAQRCELCGLALADEHAHLVEPATRRLLCSCEPCAILFSGGGPARYRRVPRGSTFLADFQLTDARWDELRVPINLAFFLHSTPVGRVTALYPSPAGATESLLPLEAWQTLVEDNPILAELEPDVEALLVNRVGTLREHYRAPIDECYKLVGLIRTGWRGLSGGSELWEEVGRFFAGLKARSRHAGGP